MTPKEIEATQEVMDNQLRDRAKNPMSHGLEDATLAHCIWLAEIALQLAKLNANLDTLNNCVLGEDVFRIADVGRSR